MPRIGIRERFSRVLATTKTKVPKQSPAGGTIVSAPDLKLIETQAITNIEQDLSLVVPEGLYRLAFDRYQVKTRFGRGSLELWFRVMDFGPYFVKPLCRYFKIERAGKRSFRASPHSAFEREFVAVFGKRPPTGVQAVDWFRHDVLVEGLVETVTKGHDQKDIPTCARYSVIRQLQGRVMP